MPLAESDACHIALPLPAHIIADGLRRSILYGYSTGGVGITGFPRAGSNVGAASLVLAEMLGSPLDSGHLRVAWL